MAAACHWKEHIPSIIAVEALVALEAIRFAQNLGFYFVEFEGDSVVVIAKLQGSKNNRSEVNSYIWDAKHSVLIFEHFKFQHIKCGRNRVAHLLAWEGYL